VRPSAVSALIMLNATSGFERVALHEKVQIQKHSNCFAEGSDLRQIDAVASRLFAPDVFLGLAEVCERWIYFVVPVFWPDPRGADALRLSLPVFRATKLNTAET